jgi:hypothetical protein
MATQEELWAWMYDPVQELKSRLSGEPGIAWEQLKECLLERAGLGAPSEHPFTDDLCRRLDEMPDDDRSRLLAGDELDAFVFQLAGEHADVPAVDEPPPSGDDSPWLAYLAEAAHLWDGTDESWAQYSEWLRYDAGERGLGSWVDAFLAEAEHVDRHELFARYQVNISGSRDTAQPLEVDAGHGDTAGAVHDLLAQLQDDVVTPALAELAQAPELAGLDDAELRALVSDVLSDQIATLTTAVGGRSPDGRDEP